MQCSDKGHAQLPQERENVTAHSSAKDAIFELQARQIDIVNIQKARCAAIGFNILFREFKADAGWIRIAFRNVVDGQRDTGSLTKLRSDSFTQIGGKGGDTTPARQIIANKCNAADL